MNQERKIYIVLDNVRSAYNVGSIFRTADAVGQCEILICGFSPTPENPKVLKTSLDAEKSVPWESFDSAKNALEHLHKRSIPVYAIETTYDSTDYSETSYPDQFGIVLGHEKNGVSEDVLNSVDEVVSIEMAGIKKSINVAVCTGVILFHIRDSK